MGKDARSLPAELRSELERLARQFGRELYPDGLPRDAKFLDLELMAGALGDEIARQIVETQIQDHAASFDEQLDECPECHGPSHKAPDQPRVLATTRGEVRWNERVAYCPRCRRAFFPSEPSVGP